MAGYLPHGRYTIGKRKCCKPRAWPVTEYLRLVGFLFMFPPLLKGPPSWSFPDPSESTQWYGEVWVNYPLSHRLSPLYFGQVFRARSQFRVIMNEFCRKAWSKDSAVTIEKANELHSQLSRWYNGYGFRTRPKAASGKRIRQAVIYGSMAEFGVFS
jgi:hypothetical protein